MPRATPLAAHALRIAAAAALAALTAAPGAAEDSSKLYAGAGLAVADFASDHEGIVYSATPKGVQLYGGFQARPLMAVELAVDRLQRVESGELLGSGVERLRISAEYSSVTVRGVFSLPLEEVLRRRQKITVFATVGVARSLEERGVLELTTGRQTSVSERDTGLVLEVGTAFDLPRVRLRTYFQSVDRADGTLNSIGGAAELRF
jgi:Outer membrane protein beta-barrel domain